MEESSDMDYFKTFLEQKMSEKKTSYLETMAIKQQMSEHDFNAEGKNPFVNFDFIYVFIDELKNALDEIKRNEKD